MKIAKSVGYRKIDGNIYAVNPVDSRLHEFNETASFIWEMISKGFDRRRILSAIVEEFDVEPAVAAADIDELLLEIEEKKLIETVR